MSGKEKIISSLEFYSARGENRFAIFYNDKMVWLGNKSTFKTAGIARRQLDNKFKYVTPTYKKIVDELITDGTIKIKQV